MEEIMQKELSAISQKDPAVKGILLTDKYGLALHNQGVSADLSGCVKAISEAGNNMKLEKGDEEPLIVIETEKDNIIIKDYQKYVLGIFKKINEDNI